MARELSKTLWRTALPLVLGVGVGVWLFRRDIDMDTLRSIVFDSRTVLGLCVAFLFVVGRDFGLAWRFHTIADGALTWRRAVRTDIMCAFTSAITPSVVGGSALAIFYLSREGIPLGRSTTLTLTTLFLDELFFVLFCPIIVALVPSDLLFGGAELAGGDTGMFLGGVRIVFWLVYAGIVVWTAILYMAIIARPQASERLIKRLAAWPVMRRVSGRLETMADNMVATSQWVKGRGARWWVNVFGSTVLSWFSRYFIVNALFWAFVPGSSVFLVFARQFVVWVVLMVSPTPGGSGISEWLFANYYGDLIGDLGIAAVLAIVWRVFSYYIYLVAGCALLPAYFGEAVDKHSASGNSSD
ncbi:MAG: flippase-like domain-containing protein [Muribaculaceae bacterium]|nr:flippase-like domain-containing protein [Muribaculaceae bacterium]